MLIYCLTSPTGKKYIGQTIRKFEERLLEHSTNKRGDCRALSHAIKKYGIENFTKEILIDFGYLENQILLDSYEIYYINLFGSFNDKNKGYNLSSGGKGGRPSDETRKKMSDSHSGERNVMYGKHHSLETKRKIIESKTGKPSSRKGVILTEEHKKKLSESRKGIVPWNKGVPRTEEEKKKMSNAKKGKKASDETRKKLSDVGKGKIISEEQKDKCRLSQPNRKPITINGIEYQSIIQAAKEIGKSRTFIKNNFTF